MQDLIRSYFEESIALKQKVLQDERYLQSIEKAIALLTTTFQAGGKMLMAGNGGSAADAQHMTAEFVGRYRLERKGYPAIALTTDSSILTAWSNDYDFETVFSRQIEALGKPGDVFIGVSTSGKSANIIKAVEAAKAQGLHTIGLLGNDGGALASMVDIPLVVPHSVTARIQEVHILTIHAICEEVEKTFVK